ncbi:unnamed protein product [Onchocerca ochengi]|uniref:ATP-dependent DNA helicase n=1 Tax=Onchocerca ochengi TaxID=42157 RepID=A0A182DXS5_ONCOC|nr:unnamed protein product [Onchocerca ochengi]
MTHLRKHCYIPKSSSTLHDDVASRKSFERRKGGEPVDGQPGIFKQSTIGRLYTVHPNQDECFYAPGETGKTFLIRLILAAIRSQNDTALALVSYGIAATLLPSRRTAHSTLKLPLKKQFIETPTCNISKASGWEKQTLLVIFRSTARTKLMPEIPYFVATPNAVKTNYKYTCPAAKRSIITSEEEFVDKVFPDIQINYKHQDWLSERSILAAENKDVRRTSQAITACTAVENWHVNCDVAEYQPAKTLQQHAACSKKING